jgi:hypothetical protein
VFADDQVRRMKVAEGRRGPRRAAERGDRGREPAGPKVMPSLLALPYSDDPEALVGGPGHVEDEPVGSRLDECRGEVFVLLPARGHVLDEGVRHSLLLPILRAAVVRPM